MAVRSLRRRMGAVVLALMMTLSFTSLVSAYELAPSARFSTSAISDGSLSICFGSKSSEQLYTDRSALMIYIQKTWGHQGYPGSGGLAFVSTGLCNNDGANIQITYDRNIACPASGEVTLAYTQTWLWEWTESPIKVNANCNINGRFDWSSRYPDGSNSATTNDWQFSIQTVIVHEIGHALGIAHSENPSSLMHAGSSPSACPTIGFSYSVYADDIAALVDEYNDSGLNYSWLPKVDLSPPSACYT